MTPATSPERVAGAAVCAAAVPPAPEAPAIADLLGLSFETFPDRDSWEQIGRYLSRASSSHHWLLGDWVLAGERQWSDAPEALAELTGLDPQTIRGARYVCQRFERVRRRTTLSFAHHREVASLDAERADRLLDRAEAERLSVRALRELAGPNRPVPALDLQTEIVAGLIRDAHSERKRLASLPGADRARVAHQQYFSELEVLAGAQLGEASAAADDDRATAEDLKGFRGTNGRRV